ncbi:NAD(P)H-hydrate dehydratase [Nannocystis sp.]|uniref:NAD(P)H-hydrate dehydratase n=1 Tax=Nannocystis sp. TaxID=1962667 RepID=UPI0025FB3A2A|nr:NAD(P)H-hydrate dehydratase [Nannocystis sp.]MBK7824111.1 NAD(P)H-hydrate dehydratase [Nannocystis sp.]
MGASSELWTRAAAAAADRHTIGAIGVPSPVLMERAALACAAAIEGVRAGRSVLVLCGPGNNGGDGVAIARILHGRGVAVRVQLLADRCEGALAEQVAIAGRAGVTIGRGLPATADGVIVDAMLGTGAAPPLRAPYLAAVAWANAASATRVAVDLPTGIDADSGAVGELAFCADLTITFERSKPGLHLTPARAFVGALVVAEIGLSAGTGELSEGTGGLSAGTGGMFAGTGGLSAGGLSEGTGPGMTLLGPGAVRGWLARLPAGAHKGERGNLGIVGGSAGTPGAAVLCGATALRGGAGLVTIVSGDPTVQAQLLALRPELMVTARGEPLLPGATALVVGPGLTRAEDRVGLAGLYADDRRPAVWDASALAEIAGAKVGGPRVLTPHPAEAARLLTARTGRPWPTAEVQADRLAAARAIAAATGAVVVLKGEGSVIAEAGRIAINVSGGPSLATAGTGDCLAGLIGALLVRGLGAWEAACAGVYVHGVAGEWLAVEGRSAVALELADAIGRVLASVPTTHPRWPRAYLG